MTTSESPSARPRPADVGPSRSSKVWLGLLSVGLVAVIVGVIVFVLARQQGQSIVLPEGTKLTIAAVLHDGDREYKPPSGGLPSWIRNNIPTQWARRILPRSWMNPGTFRPITNSHNDGITVAFETQYTELLSPGVRRPYGPFAALSFCLMNRDAGFMGKPVKISSSQNRWDPNGVSHGFAGLEFTNVPKSLRSFEIGVFLVEGSATDPTILGKPLREQTSQRIGSLKIDNPTYQPAATIINQQIEALPASRDIEGATFTLQRVFSGTKYDNRNNELGEELINPSVKPSPYIPEFESLGGSAADSVMALGFTFSITGYNSHQYSPYNPTIRRFGPTEPQRIVHIMSHDNSSRTLLTVAAEDWSPRNSKEPVEIGVSLRKTGPSNPVQKHSLVIALPPLGATQFLTDTWETSGVTYAFTRLMAPSAIGSHANSMLKLEVIQAPAKSPSKLEIQSVEAEPKNVRLSWINQMVSYPTTSNSAITTRTYTISSERLDAVGNVDYSAQYKPLTPSDRPTTLTVNFVAYHDTELKFVVMPEDARDRAETRATVAAEK